MSYELIAFQLQQLQQLRRVLNYLAVVHVYNTVISPHSLYCIINYVKIQLA